MTLETLNSMAQVLDSMENAVKLRNQARAEKRAEEAEQAKKPFRKNCWPPLPPRRNSTAWHPERKALTTQFSEIS